MGLIKYILCPLLLSIACYAAATSNVAYCREQAEDIKYAIEQDGYVLGDDCGKDGKGYDGKITALTYDKTDVEVIFCHANCEVSEVVSRAGNKAERKKCAWTSGEWEASLHCDL